MWTTLLKGDDIPHKVFPVEGYADLESRTQSLEGDPEVRPPLSSLGVPSALTDVQVNLTYLRDSSTLSFCSPSAPSSPCPRTSSRASLPIPYRQSINPSTSTFSTVTDLGTWRTSLEGSGRGFGFGAMRA